MDPEQIVLFVGGPYDGKRKKWETNMPTQKVLTATMGEPLEDVYNLRFFQEGPRKYFLAVWEGTTDTMKALIDGYHPQK